MGEIASLAMTTHVSLRGATLFSSVQRRSNLILNYCERKAWEVMGEIAPLAMTLGQATALIGGTGGRAEFLTKL